jgi:hypothetical protein
MKNLFKILVVASIGVVFTISALACCCLGKLAQAQGMAKAKVHACCKADPAKSSSKGSGSSGCCHAQASVPQIVEAITLQVPGKDALVKIIDVAASYVNMGSFRLAYATAPPGRGLSVPLYLQYRTFRL